MKLTLPGKEKQKRRNQRIQIMFTEGRGLAEIAREFGLTRERIRQIVSNA